MKLDPSNYVFEEEDNKLYYLPSEGEKLFICNFCPVVTDVTKSNNVNSLNKVKIMITFFLSGGTLNISSPFILSDLRNFDWEALDYRFQINNKLKPSEVCSHLYSIIHHQVISKEHIREVPLFQQTGWTSFNDFPAYVAGNKLITSSGIIDDSAYNIAEDLKELKLDIDHLLSTRESAEYMLKLIKLAPGISDVLVANLITGLLRSLYVEAGVIPKFASYIVGPPQSKKTTIASLISSIYNRSTNDEFALINLLSSSPAIHRSVGLLRDCCYIIDDLYMTDRKHEMKVREERLSGIIREVGNNAAKVVTVGKGLNSMPPNCNVICTAEYLLQGYSTLSRCVIIHIDKPVSNRLLFECQKDPLALSTFVYHFIRWSCSDYNMIVTTIKEKWDKYQQQRSMRTSSYERQLQAKFVFQTSMSILSKYFRCQSLLNNDLRKDTFKQVNMYLDKMIIRQIKDMKSMAAANDDNRYSKLIINAYRKDIINLEEKRKKVSKNSEGIIHKGNLCLSSEYVLKLSKIYFDDKSITINKITAELRQNGLLEMDTSNKSTKKINGIRFLQIPIDKLEAFMKDNKNEFSNSSLNTS